MSKISKTARASMGSTTKQKEAIPDSKLVSMYRDNRVAKLWPPLEQSDALLRVLDEEIKARNELLLELDRMRTELGVAVADATHYQRQLTLANSIIESKSKALADIAAVAGIDPATLAVEPGLAPAHRGGDSIGG